MPNEDVNARPVTETSSEVPVYLFCALAALAKMTSLETRRGAWHKKDDRFIEDFGDRMKSTSKFQIRITTILLTSLLCGATPNVAAFGGPSRGQVAGKL